MSNNYKKIAFTIIELLISVVIVCIGTYFAINLTNKNKLAQEDNYIKSNYFICYEAKTDNEHGSKYLKDFNGCNFEVTPDMVDKDFFEIRIIGGGGGSSEHQNGTNGEERTVIYPSIAYPFNPDETSKNKCKIAACSECSDDVCTKCTKGYSLENNSCVINFFYRAVLGEGGKVGENGGQTSLLVVDKTTGDVIKILETAAGGVTSNSLEDRNNVIMNGTTSDFGSGNGGLLPNGSGQSGEVKIIW